jgi:pyruvate kinase
MALVFGAVPVLIDLVDSAEDLEAMAVDQALRRGFVQPGDPVILTAGLPFHKRSATNMIKVITAEWS